MNTNHQKLLDYLMKEHNGCMIQTFGSTNPSNDDLNDARKFAEGMRKNIGDSGIATVEQRNSRVIVKVTDLAIPVTK
jgi:hypothetical protein